MLKELAGLVEHYSGFNIFQYVTFRASYGALTSLLFCFIFGPLLIKFLLKKKAKQYIREDGPKSHLETKVGTPTMGGLMIIGGLVLATLLWQDLYNIYTWLILGAIIGFGSLGFLDDYLKVFRQNSDGLKAIYKFSGQIIVSAILVTILYLYKSEVAEIAKASGIENVDGPGAIYLPFIKNAVFDLSWVYIPFGIFWIVGFSNAVNLTDGLDGLASGLMTFVALGFAVLSYLTSRADFSEYLQIPFVEGAEEITVASMILAGASLGFLWFNAHPAKIFMGDTGSLVLGGLVGLFSLIVKKEVLLLSIGGVFVVETLSVIIQVLSYKLTKKRVFRMAPLHHHFELKGWNETQVVIRFWIIGGLLVILSISSLKIQ